MSTSPAPPVTRGEITLQPSYFTSSLYVDSLREDISGLIQEFSTQYLQCDKTQPFALFKKTWEAQGWIWLHFKVFDGRSREKFIAVTLRLFEERMVEQENVMARVVALFGMYTFFFTQPSATLPPIHGLNYIAVPIDHFRAITTIPNALTAPDLSPLRPYTTHVLSKLLDKQAFHILPDSSLRPQNPVVLPREYFVSDDADHATVCSQAARAGFSDATGPSTKPVKKKGRPSKRDKAKKTKDALTGLDKWLEKNTYTYPAPPSAEGEQPSAPKVTHTLIAHPPVATHSSYAVQKAELLGELSGPVPGHHADIQGVSTRGPSNEGRGKETLMQANEAVFTRLRRIDEMAAEKGLEVGGEGGEMTGLARVERAVAELRQGTSKGGILNLLEGAGMERSSSGPPAADRMEFG